MEREPSSDRNPRLEVEAFYRRLLDYLRVEFERSPELRNELESFIEYILVLQHIVPFTFPSRERDLRIRTLHHGIERTAFPRLPTTLPPPGQVLHVGEHMDITLGLTAEVCWPDRRNRQIVLSDGVVVKPHSKIGKIDIVRNLPRLDVYANPLSFARELLTSSAHSLTRLAELCEMGETQLAGVETFAGISHLARLGGKLGFSVFDIEDEGERSRATNVSRNVAEYVAGNNREWQYLRANYKPAKIAYISRPELIRIFGTGVVTS